MALLAVVAPLVTTIVGFLYGTRAGAGEAGARAAKLEAKQKQIEGEVNDAESNDVPRADLVTRLRDKGLIDK